MKFLLCIYLAVISATQLFSQEASSLYQISFNTIDSGQMINMVNYQGKKVLVVACDAAQPDEALLQKADYWAKRYSDRLITIVVPANDLTNTSQLTAGRKDYWKNISHHQYIVADIGLAKRGNTMSQHPLFRWATQRDQNRHFDIEIKKSGQLFIISETGKLFAVLQESEKLTDAVMDNLLAMQVSND